MAAVAVEAEPEEKRMIQAVRRASVVAAVGFLASALLAGAAAAYQALPADARINEWNSGMNGTDWNTPPAGVDYDNVGAPVEAHDGELQVEGTVPTLNYHTTTAPLVDLNSDFIPDLDFTFEAEYLNSTATYTGFGDFWTLESTFDTTSDGNWDLILTDPSDSTEVLRANLIAGTFNGNPVAALTASATIDITAIDPNQIVSAFAFLEVDPTSPYASLFTDDEFVGFSIAQIFDWDVDGVGGFDFDQIASGIITSGQLISFTAEADGAVFGIHSSKFTPIPEPGTGLLVGLGLLLLATRRR